jgi:hypothetical protein
MTRWRHAEQDMSILAATLLEVSEAQGVLEYTVLTLLIHTTEMRIVALTLFSKFLGALRTRYESHIAFEPDNRPAYELAAYRQTLGLSVYDILRRVRAYIRHRLVMGYYTNLRLGRL